MKMQGGQETIVHHVIEDCFEDYEHLNSETVAQLLQDQEAVYRSFESNHGKHPTRASRSSDLRDSHTNRKSILPKDWEDSDAKNDELQLAIDESLAMTLQEMENEDVGTSFHYGPKSEIGTNNSAGNVGLDATTASSQAINQIVVDPVNMSYEELQSLGESIGTHPRGLSDELISYLPSSKYKAGGLFSRKRKHEECVICYVEYKRGDKLITLPCCHMYHAHCAACWLRLNKVCPVCLNEVFGS